MRESGAGLKKAIRLLITA